MHLEASSFEVVDIGSAELADIIQGIFCKALVLPTDITVFRSGKIHAENKPFLPASFLFQAAAEYSKNEERPKVKTIHAHAGSIIVPYGTMDDWFMNPDCELILLDCSLKRTWYRTYDYR